MNVQYGSKAIDISHHKRHLSASRLGPIELDSLAVFGQLGISTYYPKAAILFFEKQMPRNVLLLSSGQVKLSMTSRDGKSLILRIADAGDLLGLHAVLTNTPYELTAETASPCMVLSVRKEKFFHFLQASGEFSMNVALNLAAEYQ